MLTTKSLHDFLLIPGQTSVSSQFLCWNSAWNGLLVTYTKLYSYWPDCEKNGRNTSRHLVFRSL